MNDFKEKLFNLLEKTRVLINIDRTKFIRKEGGQYNLIPPEGGTTLLSFSIIIDNYNSYGEFYEDIEILYEETKKYIGTNIENGIYLKEIWLFLKQLKAETFPLYEDYDLEKLFGLALLFQIADFNFKNKMFFDPMIEVNIENGYLYETDTEQISTIIYKFIGRKLSIINRMIPLVENYLEIIKSKPKSQNSKSFKFIEAKYLGNSRLEALQDDLFEFGFIDNKIDLRLFKNCFSGKEVEVKINWIEDKIYLIYFVNQLVERKIIKSRTKMIALSNTFLYKSETIIPSNFYHFAETTNVGAKLKIDKCLDHISPRNKGLQLK